MKKPSEDLKLDENAAIALYNQLRKDAETKTTEKKLATADSSLDAMGVFSRIFQKIAQQMDLPAWLDFLKTKELPPVKLSPKELDFLKGGGSWGGTFTDPNSPWERLPRKSTGIQIIPGDTIWGKAKTGTTQIDGREFQTKEVVKVWNINKQTEVQGLSFSPKLGKMESFARWWFGNKG